MEAALGHLTPEAISGAMLRRENSWDRMSHYIEAILRVKKADLDRSVTRHINATYIRGNL